MPKLTGSLKARTADPTTDPALDGFRCGPGGKRSEDDTHNVLSQLRSGERTIPEVRVTEDVPPGNVVGVAAVGKMFFEDPRLAYLNGSPYISVIALSESYRGKDSRGDGPHLGDFLLWDALNVANRRHRGGVPWVVAFVDEANEPSCELFVRVKFAKIRDASRPEADAIFRRPKNLRISGAPPGA